MRWVVRALIWLTLLAVTYLGVGYVVAVQLSVPDRVPVTRTPQNYGLPFQEVRLTSTDGLELSGWWVPVEGAEWAAVLVHGKDSSKAAAYVLDTLPTYVHAGFSVLLLDLRGHGASEGTRLTLGYQEVRDVAGAVAWLEARGYRRERVVLHGWSMGAATVLLAAPELQVGAVVEDSGYADLPYLLRNALPEASGLPALFNPGIFLAARLFLDFDPWAVRPVRAARELYARGVPLFILHGTADETVPFVHAQMLQQAYPNAEFWALEGYAHVEAYKHPEYPRRLQAFLQGVQNAQLVAGTVRNGAGRR
ncbi:alpha/beta hydrolase [Marinithermus hydrothermalis]|uniref:Alpha/beta hydrolase fold protein n=1 Tax=Marinithermus hydrothermalis (strain DSM 14884 / JCM 11576 / T1) TaxID=869210 RepID=F2NKM6_MARHT|nr:alpha/beta fold hydrolase [Marinithermus hydrothermalis]AEB12686.1 alpha/beta hydrolase fold protein [Marinithermus hydrothermalis DSM 14884]